MRKIRWEDLFLIFYAVIREGAACTIQSKNSPRYRCVLDPLVCLGLSLGELYVLVSLAFEELGACLAELLYSSGLLLIEFAPHNVLL